MKYKLLHETAGVEEDLAAKYDVPTYDEYKAWCHEHVRPLVHNWLYNNGPKPPAYPSKDWTLEQEFAYTIIDFYHCSGWMPRAIIINRECALRMLKKYKEIPKEFEGVPFVFNEKALADIAVLP